ncbi:hippurate hydrolase [Microbacterium sp. cf046]|uniref:amidohydrolase n=1 Tax=Microbacterium sp. cf046 TaxID=1761803 RepID=UPI0008E66F56|nr:amidohydrolase [Microbacterium sp. cf046]SFS15626.1 hippurate hydrolase [Microbacterium sp. cf046]
MTDDPTAQARAWRRELHQHPGIAFDVEETADFLSGVLAGLGWRVHRGIGGHGLVASTRRGSSMRAIALRSDMDGLALDEATGAGYSSRNAGVMHACGHDGHMAMLLGTAAALVAADDDFDGTVHLVFQPAEEPGLGALAMIADGLFDRFPVDAIYGLHNLPGIPAGHIHTRGGAIMAAEDDFEIRIHGRGGHASMPHLVIDPLVIGADIVSSLQTIVARSIDASRSVVVSCTEFITDGARNAIPGEVIIRGDTRSFTAEDSRLVERRIRTLAESVAAAHGATCDVEYTREFRPTVNDPGRNRVVAAAASAALGASAVDADCAPRMASEDFGEFARVVPGCFAFLGTGTVVGEGGTPLHSRDYDFNDDVLEAGIAFYLQLVRSELPPTAP